MNIKDIEVAAGKVAEAWRLDDWCQRNQITAEAVPYLETFHTVKQNITSEFFTEAMTSWTPDMLIALAREMRRASLESLELDRAAFALDEIGKQGPVNLSELQREAARLKFFAASLRTWQRKAHKLGTKIRGRGAPKAK